MPGKRNSPKDEAAIQAQIAGDPDDQDLTASELAEARPFAELFPELAESIRRGAGRNRPDPSRKH